MNTRHGNHVRHCLRILSLWPMGPALHKQGYTRPLHALGKVTRPLPSVHGCSVSCCSGYCCSLLLLLLPLPLTNLQTIVSDKPSILYSGTQPPCFHESVGTINHLQVLAN